MTTTHWYRSSLAQSVYGVGGQWMCAIGAGAVYKRVRWSWGFVGDTSATSAMHYTYDNVLTAGLVTTIGNGTETPPNALTNAEDFDPPTQRWLWWEARQPVVSSIDAASGVIAWRDSGPQETPDVRSQVLATGLPAGDTLNLWFSWASYNGAWDATGGVTIWVATSVLYTTP